MATLLVCIVIVYGYGVFGNAFANVPQEYQWILGLLSPLVKDISIALLFKVAYKSAEDGEQGRYFMKFSVIHNITTKHAVFLAILVGNVATPTTTYCIIFVDFAKALYSTLKIIHNKRNGRNIEGNL